MFHFDLTDPVFQPVPPDALRVRTLTQELAQAKALQEVYVGRILRLLEQLLGVR